MNLLTNGMKIGKATVIVDIIKKGNVEIRPGTIIVPKFLTYHNTGNSGYGADAKAHNKLIHNMADKHPRDTSHVSWHLSIDENYIIQHIPFNENAWHCGDGSGKNSGNMNSIGLEICMHSNQKNYAQAEENAIALGVYLSKTLNIPITNHVPHQKWSGKFCPAVILKRDGGFTKFHDRIQKEMNPPKTIHFYTGGYVSGSLLNIHDFLRNKKWWFKPERHENGTMFFLIGGFAEGSAAAVEMEQFLKENGYWYQIQ